MTQNLSIFSQELVINSVGEFIYKPEVTFEACFRRYESIFGKDCGEWLDEKKVRLGKFGAIEHEKYVNFILLRQPSKMTFRETIQILTKIFGEQSSLFNTHWQCLNLTKKGCKDNTTFASTVNT